MDWREHGHRTWVYVDLYGKIHGEVRQLGHSYFSTYHGQNIGEYVDKTSAQDAVVVAASQPKQEE